MTQNLQSLQCPAFISASAQVDAGTPILYPKDFFIIDIFVFCGKYARGVNLLWRESMHAH